MKHSWNKKVTKIKVHTRGFFFLKLCILLNRVFLFHISVNSGFFSQMGRHCSIFCLIMLQKTRFYFFIWNIPIFLLFNSNILLFNFYGKIVCSELKHSIITFLFHLWTSCVWGSVVAVSLTCICLIAFLN